MSAEQFPARQRKKFKKHAFAIPLDLYKTDVGVFFHPDDLVMHMIKEHGAEIDFDEFREIMKRANAMAGYVVSENNAPYFYMLFDEDSPPLGVIAHEAFHVANVICERLGINVDTDNDEPIAYMIDFIVQSTVDEIIARMRENQDERLSEG